MTPRETLEKYGLKTDVKSIRERMEGRKHSELARSYILERDGHPLDEIDEALHEAYITMATVELRSADLTLLCELAEKGERAKYIEGELDDAKQDIIALTDKITRLREDVRYYRDVAYPRNPSGE